MSWKPARYSDLEGPLRFTVTNVGLAATTTGPVGQIRQLVADRLADLDEAITAAEAAHGPHSALREGLDRTRERASAAVTWKQLRDGVVAEQRALCAAVDELEARNRGRRLGADGPVRDELHSTFEAFSCDGAGVYTSEAAERLQNDLDEEEAAVHRAARLDEPMAELGDLRTETTSELAEQEDR